MTILVYSVDNGREYSDYRILRFFSSLAKAHEWIQKIKAEEIAWRVEDDYDTPDEAEQYCHANDYGIMSWPVDGEFEPREGWDRAPYNVETNGKEIT